MLLARVTTIVPLCLPGNSTFHAPFGIHQSYSCYYSRGHEAQAGFGDFLADTRVRKLKGKRDDNKDAFC